MARRALMMQTLSTANVCRRRERRLAFPGPVSPEETAHAFLACPRRRPRRVAGGHRRPVTSPDALARAAAADRIADGARAHGRRAAVPRPEPERVRRPVRGLAAAGRAARRGPRGPHDARGEGRHDDARHRAGADGGPGSGLGTGAAYDLAAAQAIVLSSNVTSLITRLSGSPRSLAEQNNALQEIAERSRLGIPLTISTDPRHHFQQTLGASAAAGAFSQWPETLGLAALRDPALVRRFAEIARREYRAVGIHEALSPQADLATEPRWPRINGTFGEDPDLARDLVRAYVEGFQGGASGLERDGVICVVKHWVGYAAAVGGYDGHNYYGRFGRLDGALDLHIRAFEGAFEVKVAGVMPTYTILQDVRIGGAPLEPVGGGFNRQLLTDLLRGRHGFDGVILSDWANHERLQRELPHGRGAAHRARHRDALGRRVPERHGALREGRSRRARPVRRDARTPRGSSRRCAAAPSRSRASTSRSRRILTQKFQLGLFENPFVDPDAAAGVAGSAGFRTEGDAAQRRALVMLENARGAIPVKSGARVFLHGIDAVAARERGLAPVERLDEAEVAVLRVAAPFGAEHPNHFFGRRQHEGRLDFRDGDADYEQIKSAAARVPTIVFVYLDRPAILTNVREKAAALIGTFGASDEALLDVATGRARAEGHLPFALPRSMSDVVAQSPGRRTTSRTRCIRSARRGRESSPPAAPRRDRRGRPGAPASGHSIASTSRTCRGVQLYADGLLRVLAIGPPPRRAPPAWPSSSGSRPRDGSSRRAGRRGCTHGRSGPRPPRPARPPGERGRPRGRRAPGR